MDEIRWTDKVYIDSQGNIRSSDGCPTMDKKKDEVKVFTDARWLKEDSRYLTCSNCKFIADYPYNICLQCGCRMHYRRVTKW